jgi:hypothetical protein
MYMVIEISHDITEADIYSTATLFIKYLGSDRIEVLFFVLMVCIPCGTELDTPP